MKRFMEERLRPVMISLFGRIAEGGLSLTIDGTPAYNEKAQFVGGKVINFACYTAMELLKTRESMESLGGIIRMVSDMEMETWGILNGLSGLYRLKKAGILEQVVDEETLLKLKKSMDWRTFVDESNHYALIRKPTNYYGVAFGIARHRELLGWDEEGHSKKLLDRLIEHIDRFSGDLLFMDETPGDGRFDRYSILVPSELVSQLLATGWEVPEKIHAMLRKSAHVFMQLANEEGLGFSYGRSIGAYGDTAALEVLSAAAELDGVLTEDEMELAYDYSVRLLAHMLDFWYDSDMESINMWENGRRTDDYRNKNRILGENLSLCMQMVSTIEHWKKAGYGAHEVSTDYSEKMKQLSHFTYIPFAKGEYERGLAIVRDGRHVWSLPLINGGKKYYNKDAYMPVPFENLVLQGVPEYSHGQLVPQLILDNGEILIPVAYFKSIQPKAQEDSTEITCIMEELCYMNGGDAPRKAERIKTKTIYRFKKNQIIREDTLELSEEYQVKKLRLVFLTYSTEPDVRDNRVKFENGVITSICAEGYEACTSFSARKDGSHDTPHGRLGSEIVWEREVSPEEHRFHVSWEITY